MSQLFGLFSEIFNIEVFIIRGLLRKEADLSNYINRDKPVSGLIRQFFGFIMSWIGLRYLYVEVDWRMVKASNSEYDDNKET